MSASQHQFPQQADNDRKQHSSLLHRVNYLKQLLLVFRKPQTILIGRYEEVQGATGGERTVLRLAVERADRARAGNVK